MPTFWKSDIETKKDEKKRRRREQRDHVSSTRAYVFERERGRCRRCSKPATDMHEIRFKSLGGKVTRNNCVALCRACHRLVQTLKVDIIGDDAERDLVFVPHRGKW